MFAELLLAAATATATPGGTVAKSPWTIVVVRSNASPTSRVVLQKEGEAPMQTLQAWSDENVGAVSYRVSVEEGWEPLFYIAIASGAASVLEPRPRFACNKNDEALTEALCTYLAKTLDAPERSSVCLYHTDKYVVYSCGLKDKSGGK
jgi:hypothetical protein